MGDFRVRETKERRSIGKKQINQWKKRNTVQAYRQTDKRGTGAEKQKHEQQIKKHFCLKCDAVTLKGSYLRGRVSLDQRRKRAKKGSNEKVYLQV